MQPSCHSLLRGTWPISYTHNHPLFPPLPSSNNTHTHKHPSSRNAAPPPPPLAERRTLTKQVSLYAGPPRARSPSLPAAASSAFTDVEWFDAVSRFPGELSIALKSLVLPEEVADAVTDAAAAATAGEGAAPAGAATADAAAGAVAAAPAPVAAVPRSISLKKAPYIPDPPLEMAGADFEFIPVPADTGFAGYWAKDAARCTPSPLPCDDALDASRLLRSAHETIPGIWVSAWGCAGEGGGGGC